ncbi:MAG: Rrf2 family transcriptional regulator [Saprospiraceae bacterium]
MFSKACEYAIRSSIFIASQSQEGRRVSLSDVSEKIESPEAFTSKILQKLVKEKIINSIKGPGGGFEIDPDGLSKINLLQIVHVMDGAVLSRCSLGLQECSDTYPCPFHHKYKPVKEELIHIYETTSLKDLMAGFKNGETFLKF